MRSFECDVCSGKLGPKPENSSELHLHLMRETFKAQRDDTRPAEKIFTEGVKSDLVESSRAALQTEETQKDSTSQRSTHDAETRQKTTSHREINLQKTKQHHNTENWRREPGVEPATNKHAKSLIPGRKFGVLVLK